MEIKGLSGLSMTDQLRTIRGVESITPNKSEGTAGVGGGNKVSFGEFLSQQFEESNRLGIEAEKAIQRSIAGEEVNPHAAMIAVQKADISLTLLMSVKERLERAYTELIRTPI